MRKRLVNSASRAETVTVIRKLKPTAEMPAAGVLKRLSEDDRKLLSKRLSEPAECVYHHTFRSSHVPGWPEDVTGNTDGGPPAMVDNPDVLSSEAEQTLFLRFNYCRNRVIRVLRQSRGRRLTAAATRELIHWERLTWETRSHIVRANTSLVLAMARRSRNNGVELSELVSEGNLALLRCVDKFDAARGFKFSTYACRAILASFSRAGAKAARQRAQFPTPYDPAMERSDHLENRRERIEYECVDELKRILFENSAELSTVERRVLDARFSLDREPGADTKRRKTLDQVGSLLGVSKERVRQIQNQAMIKLRAVLEEQLLAAS